MTLNTPLISRLFTTEQTREMDQKTIREYGISGFTLMEIAAAGAAGIISEIQQPEGSGIFICGKGNNGGDALAAARYLVDQYRHRAEIVLLHKREELSEDTGRNYEILKKIAKESSRIRFHDNPEEGLREISKADYIVDGIFGTGLADEPRAPALEIILKLNDAGKPIYAMDIPSGLIGTTGQAPGACIEATHTVTFGTNKTGFYLNGASRYTGEVHLIRLPFPASLLKSDVHLLNKELFESIPEPVRRAVHKYDKGVVHLLAGSQGLTGAAIIAAKSAVQQGAGAVFLYAPKKLLPAYEITLPGIIKIPLGEENDTFYRTPHQQKILGNLEKRPGVLVAGPGTGTHPDTTNCLKAILSQYTGPAVLDADALKLFSDSSFQKPEHSQPWLLTPHPGEARNYLGIHSSDDYQKLEEITRLAGSLNAGILLKGNPTLFADPENRRMITGYATSMFTKAGFGDYLTGSIAAHYSIDNSFPRAVTSTLYGSYDSYLRLNSPKSFNPLQLIEG